jgi:hypothetical protein
VEQNRQGTAGVARVLSISFIGFAIAGLAIGLGQVPLVWFGTFLFYCVGLGFTTAASALVLRLGRAGRSGLFGALYSLPSTCADTVWGLSDSALSWTEVDSRRELHWLLPPS